MKTNQDNARKVQRAINFDLDTNQMKTMNIYPDGYKQIERHFLKNDFYHRQGSGYISNKPLTVAQTTKIINDAIQKYPWLKSCARDIVMTNFTAQSDLTHLLQTAPQISVSEIKEKPAPSTAVQSLNSVNLIGKVISPPVKKSEGDKDYAEYDIEIQDDNRGQIAVRSEGNQAALDTKCLRKGNFVKVTGALHAETFELHGVQAARPVIAAEKIAYLKQTAPAPAKPNKQSNFEPND